MRASVVSRADFFIVIGIWFFQNNFILLKVLHKNRIGSRISWIRLPNSKIKKEIKCEFCTALLATIVYYLLCDDKSRKWGILGIIKHSTGNLHMIINKWINFHICGRGTGEETPFIFYSNIRFYVYCLFMRQL